MDISYDNDDSNATIKKPCVPIELNVIVNNLTASFNVGCELDVKKLSSKCDYNLVNLRWTGITIKYSEPRATLLVRSTGKINCSGVQTEEDAKLTARKFVRVLKRMAIPASINNFKVTNIQSSCLLPWRLKFEYFVNKNKDQVRYEPEINNSATYKDKQLRSHFNIFPSGCITTMAPSLEATRESIIKLFPLLYDSRSDIVLNNIS